MKKLITLVVLLLVSGSLSAQHRRYIIVDEDGAGPGGSDQQALLLLLQSPEVRVLGITMVSGDVWEDEATRHTLRTLEMVSRTEVPVIPGAKLPLIRTPQETQWNALRFGKVWYTGALAHAMTDMVAVPEGEPDHHTLNREDAAHFIISMVRSHPHEVTLFCGGPLTNVALALRIDPEIATLARELVIMGGSLNPQTDDPEFSFAPRHEFNFWFDPEAAHIVLTAPWPRIVDTTVDASLQAKLSPQAQVELARATSAAARYAQHYPSASPYLWDELAVAAWIDPAITTKERVVYMDVDIDHGPGYGDTLSWSKEGKPTLPLTEVHAQVEIDVKRFEQLFVERIGATPAH